jgi:DNA uptake protein ComE-like DNA-binding protein
MRAKIHYYIRFVFGLSRSEWLAMYSIFILISLFIGYEWVRAYVEGQEEVFAYRPEFWSGELVKIPESRKWMPNSKGRLDTYRKRYAREMGSASNRTARKKGSGLSFGEASSGVRARAYVQKRNVAGEIEWGRSGHLRGRLGHLMVREKKSKSPSAAWTLDINRADSVAWVGLKGIGPGYARRILAYRERLGGFYQVDQLKEVYGMDSMWVNANKGHLLVGAGIYKKIAVNRVGWNEFRHPYISYAQVKVFMAYRKHHPVLQDFQALEQIKLLDHSMWNRLRPYLSFEP